MATMRRSGPTAERFVEVTLELIAEQGGSQHVNLRAVARRVGCAHTNVYNYFDGFPGLLWEAMRRAVVIWAESLTDGLDDGLPPEEYFRRVITNFVSFPQDHPGWYRFIALDPVNDGDYPDEVLETVGALKEWFIDVIAACAPGTTRADAEDACNIIDAYISGDSASLITQRALPGDDIAGRMREYALRLFTLLTTHDGTAERASGPYPRLALPS